MYVKDQYKKLSHYVFIKYFPKVNGHKRNFLKASPSGLYPPSPSPRVVRLITRLLNFRLKVTIFTFKSKF